MKPGVVHYYGITFRDIFQKAIPKPVFKKLAVCCMLAAFNSKMYSQAKGGNHIYTLKQPSAFDIFNEFSPGRTAEITV
jgi:hypothetical protein